MHEHFVVGLNFFYWWVMINFSCKASLCIIKNVWMFIICEPHYNSSVTRTQDSTTVLGAMVQIPSKWLFLFFFSFIFAEDESGWISRSAITLYLLLEIYIWQKYIWELIKWTGPDCTTKWCIIKPAISYKEIPLTQICVCLAQYPNCDKSKFLIRKWMYKYLEKNLILCNKSKGE